MGLLVGICWGYKAELLTSPLSLVSSVLKYVK